MAKVTEIYNFRAVEDALSTSGQPTEDQLRALAAAGYEVIINLALHDDPRYSLPDEKGLVESLRMAYIHIPVQFHEPNEDGLLAFFDAIERHKYKKVHIHCAANMRVTAFFGLYRILKQGKPKGEAFEPMASVWEPNEVWASFIAKVCIKYAAQQGASGDGSTATRFPVG